MADFVDYLKKALADVDAAIGLDDNNPLAGHGASQQMDRAAEEAIAKYPDIAVAYNNRCYAYLKPDQLQKALDDCKQSLKYASLPDAIHKRLELRQRPNLY